jgi:hypothetical protein
MRGLTTDLLGLACRIFLEKAYPEGTHCLSPSRSAFLHLTPDQSFDSLLCPPVCQALHTETGDLRGYTFRLGSACYPHLKLQVTDQEGWNCVFSVDTHDQLCLPPNHPDAARWAALQIANRQLKEQIERAWEAAGLLTFNGLLRRELDHK